MQFTLEALQAKDGDCLLLHYEREATRPVLILIDGGPRGVYNDTLKQRLDELAGGRSLDLRMVLVSHIDLDHITGIVDLFKDLREQEDTGSELPYRIRTLWLNSFEKLTQGRTAAVESAVVRASLSDGLAPPGLTDFAAAVVASVPQGNQLRDHARRLGIPINQEAQDDLVRAPAEGTRVVKIADGLTFTILGPSSKELEALEESWKKAKSTNADPAAQAADYLNRTVPNLSSIVVLAEARSESGDRVCRTLLTGDAGGDLVWDAIRRAGLAEDDRCHVDLLKIQHHGSKHSVDQKFFERVTADRYVISGNGKHGNPHRDTLRWLSAARHGEHYDVYMTNRNGEEGLTEALDEFLKTERSSEPEHCYHFRSESLPSIAVQLG